MKIIDFEFTSGLLSIRDEINQGGGICANLDCSMKSKISLILITSPPAISFFILKKINLIFSSQQQRNITNRA